MGKNITTAVQDYLGKMVKFDLGVVEDLIEVKVVYEDDYDLSFEYSFRFDKESKETRFFGNRSKGRFYNIKSDRNEEFEQSVVNSFC